MRSVKTISAVEAEYRPDQSKPSALNPSMSKKASCMPVSQRITGTSGNDRMWLSVICRDLRQSFSILTVQFLASMKVLPRMMYMWRASHFRLKLEWAAHARLCRRRGGWCRQALFRLGASVRAFSMPVQEKFPRLSRSLLMNQRNNSPWRRLE